MAVSHTCSKCSTRIHTGAQHLAVHRRRLTRPVCEKKTTFLQCTAREREAAGKESDHGGSERLPCSLLARTFITGLPTGLLVFHSNSRVHYGLGYHVGCFFKGLYRTSGYTVRFSPLTTN